MMRRYRPCDADAPVLLISAADTVAQYEDDSLGWARFGRERLEVIASAGDHGSMLHKEHVDEWGPALSARLARATRDQSPQMID